MMTRFCRQCRRSTNHRPITDLIGNRRESSVADRIFHGVCSLGSSEIFADKRYECQECGEVRG